MPSPRLDQLEPFLQPPGGSEKEGNRKVRSGFGEDIRRVRNRYAAFHRCAEIHVVIANGKVGHNLELGDTVHLDSADAPREQRNDRKEIPARRYLIGRNPRDREVCRDWIQEFLNFDGDKNRLIHLRVGKKELFNL